MPWLGFAPPNQPRQKHNRLNLCRRRLVGELNSTARRFGQLARRGPAGSLDPQRRRAQTLFLAGSGASTPISGPRRLTLEHTLCRATTLRLEHRLAGLRRTAAQLRAPRSRPKSSLRPGLVAAWPSTKPPAREPTTTWRQTQLLMAGRAGDARQATHPPSKTARWQTPNGSHQLRGG